jgi:hypothetical protein
MYHCIYGYIIVYTITNVNGVNHGFHVICYKNKSCRKIINEHTAYSKITSALSHSSSERQFTSKAIYLTVVFYHKFAPFFDAVFNM